MRVHSVDSNSYRLRANYSDHEERLVNKKPSTVVDFKLDFIYDDVLSGRCNLRIAVVFYVLYRRMGLE